MCIFLSPNFHRVTWRGSGYTIGCTLEKIEHNLWMKIFTISSKLAWPLPWRKMVWSLWQWSLKKLAFCFGGRRYYYLWINTDSISAHKTCRIIRGPWIIVFQNCSSEKTRKMCIWGCFITWIWYVFSFSEIYLCKCHDQVLNM